MGKIRVPVFVQDTSGWVYGWDYVETRRLEDVFNVDPEGRRKLVVLNALVPPKTPLFVYTVPIDYEIAVSLIRSANKVESYIGHPATAELLGVPVNRGMYEPKPYDIAVVARLKRRLPSPSEVVELDPNDLEYFLVFYLP